jgi:hypothetical protein
MVSILLSEMHSENNVLQMLYRHHSAGALGAFSTNMTGFCDGCYLCGITSNVMVECLYKLHFTCLNLYDYEIWKTFSLSQNVQIVMQK